MKVKLHTIFANPAHRGFPGDILDVSDEEGQLLIAGNYASAILAIDPKPEPKPEIVAEANPVDSAPAAPVDLSKLSIKQVLALIAEGKLTKAAALAQEQQSAKPRPSLLAQLSEPSS